MGILEIFQLPVFYSKQITENPLHFENVRTTILCECFEKTCYNI